MMALVEMGGFGSPGRWVFWYGRVGSLLAEGIVGHV